MVFVLWFFAICTDRACGAVVGGPSCRLIFSLNPGRSGSGYLSKILSLADQVSAGHERVPTMFGSVLRQAKRQGLEATYLQRWQTKVRAIEKHLNSRPDVAYAETSHGFLKTFWDVVLDRFVFGRSEDGTADPTGASQCRVDLIWLRRSVRQVVCSLYRRDWGKIHDDWLLEPGCNLSTPALGWLAEKAQLFPRHNCRTTDCLMWQIDALLWYVWNHYHQVLKLQKAVATVPSVRIHAVDLADLQSMTDIRHLLRSLDLRPSKTFAATAHTIIGQPYNSNAREKTDSKQHSAGQQQQQQLLEVACTERGLRSRLRAMLLRANQTTEAWFDAIDDRSVALWQLLIAWRPQANGG